MAIASNRPRLFVLSDPRGLADWRAFSQSESAPLDAGRLAGQWRDWLSIQPDNLGRELTDEQVEAAFTVRKAATETGRYGTVAWYPWRRRGILLLEEAEFTAVRTNRNQLKIRPEEQEQLAGKAVGIVGLSVGRTIALALAMERIVGTLHIADADDIELSNLNRMSCSLELGMPKWMSAARAIAEVDPYLEVKVWPQGFRREDIADFLDGVDLVVDACDGPEAKALLRLGARDRRIPLIMETNDRGLLDVERYDLEETVDFLHGRVTAEQLTDLAQGGTWTREWLDAFVDLSSISPRAADSLAEVGRTWRAGPNCTAMSPSVPAAAAIIRRLLGGGHRRPTPPIRFA